MTIAGNDSAQPKPEDQTAPPAADQQPHRPLNITAIEEVDPDDIEHRNAMAAAEAEEAAARAPKDDAATGTVSPAPAEPQAPTDQPLQPGQPPATVAMIPKPRLDEALSKTEKALQEAAYWRGRAEAALPPGQPGAPGAQPPPATPEQRLSAIHTEIDALAEKFDACEITMKDFKAKERELQTSEQAIREEVLVAKVKPASAPQQGGGDALYLNTLTAELETAHPWVNVFEQVGTDADWNYLRTLATDNLLARNIDPSAGPVGTFELRKEIAALADKYGPALLSDRAKAKNVALPGQAQPPAPPQPGLSPEAQARQAKLTQQAAAPPSLASMNGSVSPVSGEPSEAQLATMTDDDYDKLPEAVRRKARGISA